jgi:hypothetical protein
MAMLSKILLETTQTRMLACDGKMDVAILEALPLKELCSCVPRRLRKFESSRLIFLWPSQNLHRTL